MNISKSCTLLVVAFIALSSSMALTEGRPQNTPDANQNIDTVDIDLDDLRSLYYDVPMQPNVYPNLPMDRLQMMIAQYRPTSYLRSPSANELYRLPEAKRQVRYRQCYFNPISCFRK
ncbi:allatostatin C [Haematobia irritans]|uniref:Putative secreted protein n=1 Tax=Haematobia irritans TaxID=7368 RepID=A0A1L8EGH0_HAEIR